MPKTHSSAACLAGQLTTGRSLLRVMVFPLLICLLGFATTGCRNLYRQTQSLYPAETRDRLKLRIEEAQQAEKRAERADSRLQEELANGRAEAEIQTDLDRLETAVLNFNRRVASARDVAAGCEHSAELDAELERLEQRATELLERVRLLRQESGPSEK